MSQVKVLPMAASTLSSKQAVECYGCWSLRQQAHVPGEGASRGREENAGCVGKGKYGQAAVALGEAEGSFSLPDVFPSSPPQSLARSFQKLWEVPGST